VSKFALLTSSGGDFCPRPNFIVPQEWVFHKGIAQKILGDHHRHFPTLDLHCNITSIHVMVQIQQSLIKWERHMFPQKYNIPFLLGPRDSDKACLLMHGFTGTSAEMRGLGEALAAQGIRVYGIALAGHSGDPDDLARSNRKEWIASATAGFAQLAQYRHIFAAGLSMGGMLSLMLAAHYPDRIAGVIAMSTPTYFAGAWQIKFVRPFMKWFYPMKLLDFSNVKVQEEYLASTRLHWQEPHASIDFSDPRIMAEIKETRLAISAIDELHQLLIEGRQEIGKVRSPLLIIHSRRDIAAAPACAEEIFRLATHANPKSLHWLKRSDHVITVGPEREEVFELAGSFIEIHSKTRNKANE
jgi:carboxylesterase